MCDAMNSQAILQTDKVLISEVSVIELKMLLYSRRGPPAVVLVEDMLRLPMFDIVPPGPADLEAAFGAFVVFGRGSGHPAALNFGGLFSYALAKARELPLLFKGNVFTETDILPAIGAALP